MGDDTRICFQTIMWDIVNLINLQYNRVHWQAFENTAINFWGP